ncbi:MAG: hypothetical protein ACYCUV_11720 [Phycisphaerae bacterium]
MEADAPNTNRKQCESTADQSGRNLTESLDTHSPAPPAKAKEWSKLPPIAFNEIEDPWRKTNDQTVPMTDDNTSPASRIPSDIFLG